MLNSHQRTISGPDPFAIIIRQVLNFVFHNHLSTDLGLDPADTQAPTTVLNNSDMHELAIDDFPAINSPPSNQPRPRPLPYQKKHNNNDLLLRPGEWRGLKSVVVVVLGGVAAVGG